MEISGTEKRVQFSISLPDYGNVSQLKGILKTRSDPLMLQGAAEEEGEGDKVKVLGKRKGMDKVMDGNDVLPGTSTSVLSSIEDGTVPEQNGPTKQSSQEYENLAYIHDEFDSKEDLRHLSDVVEQIIGESSPTGHIQTDVHPFGRSTLLDRILGDRHKHTSVESSVIVIWVLFAVCIVGMAGGIIFLAETYVGGTSNKTSVINSTY